MNALQESPTPSKETTKEELTQEVYEKIISENGMKFLSDAKRSADKNGEKDDSWDAETFRERFSGIMRGMTAEVVSEKTPLADAETVYSSKDANLGAYKTITPQEYSGAPTNRKGDILSYLVDKSLREKPLPNSPFVEMFKKERLLANTPKVSQEEYYKQLRKYLKEEKDAVNEEIMKGYTWGPVKGQSVKGKDDKPGYPAGEFYGSTVIPDKLIVNGNGELIGFVEDKAYIADELAKLFTLVEEGKKQTLFYKGTAAECGKTYQHAKEESYTLGADLNKESTFVDILSGFVEHTSEKAVDNIVVLRFPADMPDNLLNRYGETKTLSFKNYLFLLVNLRLLASNL
jgi:hypothetical protein